jgi:excisionase family DNA binding protein
MTNTENRQTITVEQAAVLLGIGRASAYQLARTGKLPGIRRLGDQLADATGELIFIPPRSKRWRRTDPGCPR